METINKKEPTCTFVTFCYRDRTAMQSAICHRPAFILKSKLEWLGYVYCMCIYTKFNKIVYHRIRRSSTGVVSKTTLTWVCSQLSWILAALSRSCCWLEHSLLCSRWRPHSDSPTSASNRLGFVACKAWLCPLQTACWTSLRQKFRWLLGCP